MRHRSRHYWRVIGVTPWGAAYEVEFSHGERHSVFVSACRMYSYWHKLFPGDTLTVVDYRGRKELDPPLEVTTTAVSVRGR